MGSELLDRVGEFKKWYAKEGEGCSSCPELFEGKEYDFLNELVEEWFRCVEIGYPVERVFCDKNVVGFLCHKGSGVTKHYTKSCQLR